MPNETLEAAIKTRIPEDWKVCLQKIARRESLAESDIVRRAISQFLIRQKRTKAAQA